jgi:hypothetical protein
MNYNFTRFDYSFKFSTSIRIQDINEDFFLDAKERTKEHLLMEFNRALNSALYGDPAGNIDEMLRINNEKLEHIRNHGPQSLKTLLERRLLRSLIDDWSYWESRVSGGGDAGTWTEWYGPEYKTPDGKAKEQFAKASFGLGCYVDGGWAWTMSRNFFRKDVRKVWKAFNSMRRRKVFDDTLKKEETLADIIRNI